MATTQHLFGKSGIQKIDSKQGEPGGPLAYLYTSSYDFNNLFYPRNLGDNPRGHYMIFYINVASNSKYIQGDAYKGAGQGGSDIGIIASGGRTATNQANQAASMPGGTQNGMDALTTRKTRRIQQAIALYMPETVNVQYNSSWQSESLTDALGALGKYGTAAVQAKDKMFTNKTTSGMSGSVAEILGGLAEGSIAGNGATDFALFTQGYAINPQLEVLFKGTEMRTFQFDFLFSPFDENEAQNILNIIKAFKFHQAPEVNTDSVGRFFVPPSEFDIDFLVNGQINDKIHQIGTVVLQNLNVDYSPNGWSTFPNGMPTQIRMNLQFMETEIVTKQRVAKDNY